MNDLYSNAFNFASYLSTGVDPRTGQYTASIEILTLHPFNLEEGSYPLSLSFSMYNTLNNGFGIGWKLSATYYDIKNRLLVFNNGETYKSLAIEIGKEIDFIDRKLKNFKLLSEDNNTFFIYHKNGIIEKLEKVSLSQSRAVTTSLLFENGERFDFFYDVNISGTPCLTKIIHHQTELTILTLYYTGSTCDKIEYFDDEENIVNILFTHRNNNLISVSIPYLSSIKKQSAEYKFTYVTLQNTYLAIESFKTPTGYLEQLKYNPTGLSLTNNQKIPCVTTFSAYPGNNQPAILKSYQYSAVNNFTGFSSGRQQIDADQDNLYLVKGIYNYSTTERLLDKGNIISSTERTFNRFHLLIKEEKIESGAWRTQEFIYNEMPDVNYYKQPDNLQLVAEKSTTYFDPNTNQSRQETEKYITDSWGNNLSTFYPDGTEEINQYYPSEGEDGNCPADPLGFCRFLKSKIKKPAKNIGQQKQTKYEWKAMPTFNDAAIKSHIRLAKEVFADTLIKKYDYINSPSTLSHSLLAQIKYIMNDLSTFSIFSYSFTKISITRKEENKGFDNTEKSTLITTALLSRHQLSTTDENNTTIHYRYSPEGKLVEKSISAINQPEIKRRYHYYYTGAQTLFLSDWPVMVEETPNGVNRIIKFDGMGRIISIYDQDDDGQSSDTGYTGTYRETFSQQFNVQGFVSEEIMTDWLWDLTKPSLQRNTTPLRYSKKYHYDGWGGLISTLYNDGRIEYNSYNPITMINRHGLDGLGYINTHKNHFDKPISINLMSVNNIPHSTTSIDYDGFGRKTTEKDNNNNIIRYQWDIFDRLIQKRLPDNTQLNTDYVAFSPGEYVSQVSLNDTQFAKSIHDGLCRIKQDTIGDRTTEYQYEQGCSLPNTVIPPSSTPQILNYHYYLGGVIKEIKTHIFDQSFAYYSDIGKLQQATEKEINNQYNYYPSGRIKHEEINKNQTQLSACDYRYSMLGALQYYRDAMGNEHYYDYDEYGRLISSRQGAQSAIFKYDKYSRLIQSDIKSDNSLLSTKIEYDEFSRETKRIFTTKNAIEILSQSYTPEGKLKQRVIINNSLVLTNERFEYDNHGRLQHYQCDGIDAPKDSMGQTLKGQHYYYDSWGNIKQLDNIYTSGTKTLYYQFSEQDPTQLISISDNLQTIKLQYDKNGNLTQDEKGQTLTYDEKDRLTEVYDKQKNLVCRYYYDAQGKLIEQRLNNDKSNHAYYANRQLSNAVINDEKITWLNDSTPLRLGHTNINGQDKYYHEYALFTDGTPCRIQSGDKVTNLSYTPYGLRSLYSTSPGMAGAQIDPVTGWYFLGNGERIFNPILMRFHSPDSWSPFGKGGINPYIYSLGDPINRMDPTGHMSVGSIIGITLTSISLLLAIISLGAAIPAVAASSTLLAAMAVDSVIAGIAVAAGAIGDVLSIASIAIAEKAPETSQNLARASIAFAVFSMGASIMSTASGIWKKSTLNTAALRAEPALEGFTSLSGEMSKLDIFITGTDITLGLTGISMDIASEFVDDKTASILGMVSLGAQSFGLVTNTVSIWRGWQSSKHSYDFPDIELDSFIPMERFRMRESFEDITQILTTRL